VRRRPRMQRQGIEMREFGFAHRGLAARKSWPMVAHRTSANAAISPRFHCSKAPCFARVRRGLTLKVSAIPVSQSLETNMQRKASARWQGTVKEGKGSISTQSGVLSDAPYGFNARFGDGKGTNPEELLGAAHAGCFTMALSFALNNAGFTAEAIDTEAAVTLEKVNDAWTITAIHLTTRA